MAMTGTRFPNPNPASSLKTLLLRPTAVNCSPPGSSFLADRPPVAAARQNLLTLIVGQQRGVKTLKDPAKRAEIVGAADEIAGLGGRDKVTTGPALSATWRLLWTTEKEQLFIIENAGLFGTQAGDVLQVIDVEQRTLNNVITFPPHGAFFVRSNIEIASPQRVNFKFESVYLDDEIRVAKDIRGDYLVVERAPYSWKE